MSGKGLPSVSAVVVTWNSARDISTCLDSLQTQDHSLESIIVVDNASTDETTDIIQCNYPTVNLIRQSENGGFAQANNIGITASDSDWALTLNPDARISPDFISTLIQFADDKEKTGALGGLLLRENESIDGRPVIDSTGIEIYRSRRVYDRYSGEILTRKRDEPERIFGICAAAALYRRKMLEDVKINGEVFPERFFSYYEDSDLAWRAWRRGWEAWFIPQAVGWHRRGGSLAGDRFTRYQTHRNRLWMIARNEPLHRPLTAIPDIIVHEILILLRVIRYPYLMKGTLQALAGLPAALRERKSLPDIVKQPPPFKPGSGFKLKNIFVPRSREDGNPDYL